MWHAANDFEPNAVQQDECAHRRAPGEQGLQQFVAEDDHIASLRSVQFIQPASLLEGKITYFAELGLRAQDFSARVGEFADLVQVGARNQRAGISDMRAFADIHVVLVGEQIRTGGVHAALYGGRAPREDKHDVLAELGQLALVAGAEAFAHTYQKQQRSHTPGDAEHGEERTQLVCPQAAEDLREDVQNHPHNRETLYLFGCRMIDTSDWHIKMGRPADGKSGARAGCGHRSERETRACHENRLGSRPPLPR